MPIHARSTPLALAVMSSACALSSLSCSSSRSSDDSEDPSARTTAAISGGFVDDDTPEANVVVKVAGCSGTLITPQIVLTAAHCIVGAVPKCNALSTAAKVRIGRDTTKPMATFGVAATESKLGGCVQLSEVGDDIGLVYLDRPVAPSTVMAAAAVAVPRVVRPTFVKDPPADGSGAAGYSPFDEDGTPAYTTRNVAFFGGSRLDLDGDVWSMRTIDFTTASGDSGGPLFRQLSDQTRAPIGVYSALTTCVGVDYVDQCMRWADVTHGGNKQFILDRVLEKNAPASLRHTPTWLSHHGKTLDDWWGELDYSGPCDKASDKDCDGWWDVPGIPNKPVHDSCPFVANPKQTDKDGDGNGDECDACPWDPDNDADGDGVCMNGPSGPLSDPDNCPQVANDQKDCNEEVERAHGQPIRGDACDDTPCAYGRSEITEKRIVVDTCKQSVGLAAGRAIRDRIEAFRVAPRTPTGGALIAPGFDVFGRFCQYDPKHFAACTGAGSTRDDQLNAANDSNGAQYAWTTPWRPVTLDLAPRTSSWVWSFNDTDTTASKDGKTWAYLLDHAFWSSTGKLPPDVRPAYANTCAPGSLAGNGTCLDGRFWFHEQSSIVSLRANMANSYFDIRPDEAWVYPCGSGMMEMLRPFFWRVPPDWVVGDPAWHMRPVGVDPDGGPVLLGESGESLSAKDVVSAALRERMRDDGVVLATASETRRVGGNARPDVVALVLDAAGTRVLDAVLERDRGLVLASEEGARFDGAIDAPGRVGHTTLFSRALGGAVVVGGDDARSGEPRNDVQVFRFGVDPTSIVPTEDLGRVRAAVVRAVDHRLYVLGERDSAMRLFRVDPFSGATDILEEWPIRAGAWDRHELTLDADGEVILVASSRRDDRTRVVRLGFDRGRVRGVASVPQALRFTSFPLLVDEREYGLVATEDARTPRAIQRWRTLERTADESLAEMF